MDAIVQQWPGECSAAWSGTQTQPRYSYSVMLQYPNIEYTDTHKQLRKVREEYK